MCLKSAALVPDPAVRGGTILTAYSQQFTRGLNGQRGGHTSTHSYWTADIPAARCQHTCFLKDAVEILKSCLFLDYLCLN